MRKINLRLIFMFLFSLSLFGQENTYSGPEFIVLKNSGATFFLPEGFVFITDVDFFDYSKGISSDLNDVFSKVIEGVITHEEIENEEIVSGMVIFFYPFSSNFYMEWNFTSEDIKEINENTNFSKRLNKFYISYLNLFIKLYYPLFKILGFETIEKIDGLVKPIHLDSSKKTISFGIQISYDTVRYIRDLFIILKQNGFFLIALDHPIVSQNIKTFEGIINQITVSQTNTFTELKEPCPKFKGIKLNKRFFEILVITFELFSPLKPIIILLIIVITIAFTKKIRRKKIFDNSSNN